jgi:hypothetical protein
VTDGKASVPRRYCTLSGWAFIKEAEFAAWMKRAQTAPIPVHTAGTGPTDTGTTPCENSAPAIGRVPAASLGTVTLHGQPVTGAEEPTDASDRTGGQGRPTSRHLVEMEFQRRAMAREVADTLKAEAQVLSAWLTRTHVRLAQMTPKTVENCIRKPYKLAKATN